MSTIKISELATSNIALTDFFAKADATGLANKNTIQELSNLLKTVDDTAFKGSIAIADVPSENGWYFASESGTYTNCGGLVINTTDNIAIIIVSGTYDTFNKIDIPVNITIDAVPTNGSNNAVSSNGVFDSLALKAPLDSPTFTGTVSGIDKAMIGLPNVDNTSDADKPISTATQTALDNVTITTDSVPTQGSTNAVQSGGTFDSLALKSNAVKLEVVPVVYGTNRVRSQIVLPGWAYTSVGGGSTAFDVINGIKGGFNYTFEGCTMDFSSANEFIFLNGDGQRISKFTGLASDIITTPLECRSIIFSISNSSQGTGFKFVQVSKEVEGYEKESSTVVTNGVNLADGRFYLNSSAIEEAGVFGLVSNTSGAITGAFEIEGGKRYYSYLNLTTNVELYLMDENDVGLALLTPEFTTYATVDDYRPFDVPLEVGGVKVSKAMLRIAGSTAQVTEVQDGSRTWAIVEERNYRIIEDFKSGNIENNPTKNINDIIDLRQPIKKTFFDKNIMLLSDSTGATQSNAPEAYFNTTEYFRTNQVGNKLYGGRYADVVRRLRPKTWTNYSNGGWTMTYDGSNFGQAIYTNGDSGNYLYNLEKFINDYDASPTTMFAPDVFMVASCINDFANPTEAWVTDSEISASGLSYDDYMEQTFISSGTANDTLIPLQDVNLNKIGGALRYIIERIYIKFPKCFIAVATSNKTASHSREGQYKCTRDMVWITKRLNAQLIDVFDAPQFNMLREFKDSTTGTRDDLYLTVDGIHDYATTGKGYQRLGRFISNELINGFYPLDDFNV